VLVSLYSTQQRARFPGLFLGGVLTRILPLRQEFLISVSSSDLPITILYAFLSSFIGLRVQASAIADLRALATHLARAKAVDAQREACENQVVTRPSWSAGRGSHQVSMAVD
jgi:hypothetical protein